MGTQVPLITLVADFETTTDPNDCRVWLWAVVEIGSSDAIFGNDIHSFIEYVSEINCIVYFHNLAFDGQFILSELMVNRGYVHSETRKLEPKQLHATINHMGKWFSVTIKHENGNVAELRDSLKKIPLPVSKIPKAYGLNETKTTIEYDAKRPMGYVPTDEEIEYIKNDVLIVARALEIQLTVGTKLTVGSDALAEYKKLCKSFDSIFPQLSPYIDGFIRESYRGGFTYADPRYSKRIIGTGCVYDVNSLYPYVMRTRRLPYGDPRRFGGVPNPSERWPLWVAEVTFSAKIKTNHIPTIQVKNNPYFSATEYVSSVECVTMTVTSVDWGLWLDHYDITVLAWHGGYYFHAAEGLFDNYIDKWVSIKENSEGGMRTIAKLFLNSLYGKFATNPDVTGKIPIVDNGVVKLKTGRTEMRSPIYIPMGTFITAYAREYTIRKAQEHYPQFAYADTDSLHLLGSENTLDVHPTRLGAWKLELEFQDALYSHAKCYTERDNSGEYHTHIAGLPADLAQTVRYEHYLTGHEYTGKLTPLRVPGGIVLKSGTFRLTSVREVC